VVAGVATQRERTGNGTIPSSVLPIFVAGVLAGLAIAKLVKTLADIDRECARIVIERLAEQINP